MTRTVVCALSLGALALLVPANTSAQTRIDVGVWTPGGGGRVVIGGSPVYRAPRPVIVAPAPVYVVQPSYRRDRGKHKGWAKKGRVVYGPAPYAYGGWGNQREYRRDVARAEAEYRRNLDRAQREYYDDLRDAQQDYRRGRW